MSAMVGVWNAEKNVLEPGGEREVALLGNAVVMARMALESGGIAYEGEVSVETAILRGRDLYLGWWVDGKHYARIVKDALE